MALNDDLTSLINLETDLADNKVVNFAYTQEAYTNNEVDGTDTYSTSNENNIPLADPSLLKINETTASRGFRSKASVLTRMLVNHIFGRVSYNLNKIHDNFLAFLVSIQNSLGTANGIATLDPSGRIPSSQLPLDSIEYKGSWNADTNTPTLADGTGTSGDMYVVSVAGTQDLGSGSISFLVDDRVIYNGSVWQKISNGDVKTVNDISPDPANGNVTLTKADIGLGNVVNTGDSSVPEENGTKKFTTGGAYSFFANCTNPVSWLSKVFGWALGKIWTKSSSFSTLTFYSVYYANGLWVACNDSHGLYYSTDGMTWTLSSSTFNSTFYSVYYANGLWVAGSNSHGFWYSTDGIVWTQSPRASTYTFYSVYYANGIWVAGSSSSGLWYSTDGMFWTRVTGATASFSFPTVYYANNIWVACSYNYGLWYSTDGMSWTKGLTTNYSFNTAYYANNLWVACSISNGLWYSTDGMSWTSGTGGTSYTFKYVYYGNGIWVACSDSHGLYYSTDGMSWTQVTVGTSYTFYSVYYANGIWVACSDSHGLYYSTDGMSWTQIRVGTSYTFYSVYYANDTWVASSNSQGLWYSSLENADVL